MVETTAEEKTDIPRIERRTLHEEVLARIRDLIIEGRILPGTRINEGKVGEQLGVSRTPLREAIKSLASEGLVEIVPTKGAVVRVINERELADILESLALIEQHAGRTLCASGDEPAIRRVEDLHAAMMKHYRAKQRLAYFKCNQDIHSAIVRGSGNRILAEMHDGLQARIKRLRYVGNGTPENWAHAVAEHEEMIAALKARDGERLAKVLGEHLTSAYERVKGIL